MMSSLLLLRYALTSGQTTAPMSVKTVFGLMGPFLDNGGRCNRIGAMLHISNELNGRCEYFLQPLMVASANVHPFNGLSLIYIVHSLDSQTPCSSLETISHQLKLSDAH